MRPRRFLSAFAAVFVFAMVGAAQAASVYLKDGGIIECRSFRQKGNDFFVKVNRDLIIPFSKDEIDLNKTFARKKKPAVRSHKPAAPPDTGMSAQRPAVAAVAAKAEQKPIPPPEAAKKPAGAEPVPTTAGKAPSVAPQAATPAAPPVPKPAPNPAPAPQPEQAVPAPPPISPIATIPPATLYIYFAVAALLTIVVIAGNWKVFEKAGVAGWKCLVPIYNLYLLIIIAGKPGWWVILMFIPIVSVAIYLLAMLALASRFGKGPLFGIGLFFLPFIFIPLLGFDNSEYS